MTTLFIDLGNTRLKYWLVDSSHSTNPARNSTGNRLTDGDIKGAIIAHDAHLHLKAPNELLLGLADTFARFDARFIGISSVLGALINADVAEALAPLGVPYQFAKVSAAHPLLTSDYQPEQLGVDRWLQMLGAMNGTDKLCVIGCGTALTIDLIEQGRHLGGYIFPNVHLQRQALYAGTQQIDVASGAFSSLELAGNTADAVNHGILLSVVGAINTISARYPSHRLILTGGDAPNLAPHISLAPEQSLSVADHLLLKGLWRYFAGEMG